MLPDNRSGFYVTNRCDNTGRVRALRFYETLKELIVRENYRPHANYSNRNYFSENHNKRVPFLWDRFAFLRRDWPEGEEPTMYALVVVDHNENIIPLCELNRVANQAFGQRRYHQRNRRRTAWGGWKKPRSTQEKRQYYAALDQAAEEDVNLKLRRRRSPRLLPDAWDDWDCHNDKCWKTQSKRKHQWKP